MIKFYDEGEHPAGFVGYRVHVGLIKKNAMQRYFSIRKYSKPVAKRLAQACHNEFLEKHAADRYEKGLAVPRAKIYGRFKPRIATVRHIRFTVDRCRPTLILNNGVTLAKQRVIEDEEKFIAVWEFFCKLRAEDECIEYASEWAEYWNSLRPSWRRVQAFYAKHYEHIIW